MNKRGFTLYVTLIYMLLITSASTLLMMNLAVCKYIPGIFTDIKNNGEENMNLLKCVQETECADKLEFLGNKEEILESLVNYGQLDIDKEVSKSIINKIIEMNGEDELWILNGSHDLIIGDNQEIIYRILVHNK